MYTFPKRAPSAAIPGYSENAVLQLIAFSGVTFVAYHFTLIVMLILGVSQPQVAIWMQSNTALPYVAQFGPKAWTLFTYGWIHLRFWEWFSNMIWLFALGSALQFLEGYKQVIPGYLLGLFVGGAFYLLSQLAPFSGIEPPAGGYVGATAGITAIAMAALTVAPGFRFQLVPTFYIPLGVMCTAYVLLNLIVIAQDRAYYAIPVHLGGILAGLAYGWQLRRGRKPGNAIYNALYQVERIVTPDEDAILERRNKKRNGVLRALYEAREGITQDRIDEILDKITEKGYESLSMDERDLLLRASKD